MRIEKNDDNVMGGLTDTKMEIKDGIVRWWGDVDPVPGKGSEKNRSGFSSIRVWDTPEFKGDESSSEFFINIQSHIESLVPMTLKLSSTDYPGCEEPAVDFTLKPGKMCYRFRSKDFGLMCRGDERPIPDNESIDPSRVDGVVLIVRGNARRSTPFDITFEPN